MPIRVTPRHAVFDLAHLATLSGEPGHCLVVSSKTLYILQNLVVSDVPGLSRYAIAMLDGGYYVPCQPWSDEYGTVLEIIEGVETEVYPVAVYGYTDVLSQLDSFSMGFTGTKTVDYTVPAGEVWEFQNLSAKDVETAVTVGVHVVLSGGGQAAVLKDYEPVAAGVLSYWEGKIVLKRLQKMRFRIVGCQIYDTVECRIHVAKLVPW